MDKSKSKRALTRFRSDEAGSMTTMFAIASIAIIACTGAAVDYVRLLEAKTAYTSAADSAVLGAIAAAVNAERTGKTGGGGDDDDDGDSSKTIAKAAKTVAQGIWLANLKNMGLVTDQEPVIVVSKSGNTWTAKVTLDSKFNTVILGSLGLMSTDIHVFSDSQTELGKSKEYWDYSIVVDDSASMGLGATPAVMATMLADPKIKCSFACHYDSKGVSDTMATAKAAGYKLRIDVVDDAIDGMVATMKTSVTDNNVTAALYGLNNNIDQLVKTTTDLQSLADFDIKMALTPSSSGNTNYRAAMNSLTGKVGKAGDGTSDKDPKKVVFIVTDGVHDTVAPESNAMKMITKDHYDGPMDPAFCDKLKANGVKVGVLYIDYYVQSGYEGYINGFKSKMLPNLQGCASDGLFFNATSPEGISKSLQDMLAAAMSASDVRLTQ